MKSVLTTVLMAGFLAFQAGAQDTNKAASANPELKPDKENVSYSIGMNIGKNIKTQLIDQGREIDVDTLAQGIKDTVAGGTTRLTEQQAQQVMMAMSNELRAKQEAERKEASEKNKTEGETFLAQNAKKPGVKTHEVKLSDGKTAQLQYKVIKEGTGEKPTLSDTVTTHYKGTLINGTEFDSSHKRGQPAEFPVTGVIKGWTEALQLMKVGSKYELYIPSELAYGERGSGRDIGPNATLIFEIELLGIKPKVETNQAVSGEIIKVPSAEELKKGAKIEVIRPGQTNELK